MKLDIKVVLLKIILPAVGETILMVSVSTMISAILGFILAICVYLTNHGGLRPNKAVNRVLETVINMTRSFPFIILIVSILPLTRLIAGTSVGAKAAIVPITVASTPFMSRLFNNSFKNVKESLIEAGKSFGLTDMQIMKNIVVKESMPSIISDITLSVIAIIGSSAMAGAVGAGGLGTVAMTYGYQNFNNVIMYGTVIVIIIMVQIIQWLGNKIYINVK